MFTVTHGFGPELSHRVPLFDLTSSILSVLEGQNRPPRLGTSLDEGLSSREQEFLDTPEIYQPHQNDSRIAIANTIPPAPHGKCTWY